MKHFFTLFLLFLSIALIGQEKASVPAESTTGRSGQSAVSARSAATSTQIRTSEPVKLPYDLNDRYMGRASEFLGNLTVSQLPADFPVYEKTMGLKEYDQAVEAFYYKHMDIVREPVKEKLKH
ncbi:MAG: hypothetical protein K0Q95_2553 [Bacteroidota bacterium]|jgi:hypothetical protein|nr:hypothetical protein [Bacteroidota bacterium]